jgi:hypothetical protein
VRRCIATRSAESLAWRSRLWRRLSDQSGFEPVTITILGWIAITSILSTTIIGGSQVVGSVQNKQISDDASQYMRQGADTIVEKVGDRKDPTAMELLQTAKAERALADKTEAQANLEVWRNVSQTAYDAVLGAVPFSKLTKVGKALKFGWDFYGGTQLGQAAQAAVDIDMTPRPDVVKLQKAAVAIETEKGGEQAAAKTADHLGAYILDVKANAAQNDIEELVPNTKLSGASSAEYDALTWDFAKTAVLDMETDAATAAAAGGDEGEVSLPAIGESPFKKSLAAELDLVDPSNKPSVGVGGVMLSPEDKAALKAGDKDAVIGQYVGKGGSLVPVVIRKDDAGKLKTEFSLIEEAPVVNTSAGFKPDVMELPSYWDGSRSSCPFLSAYDGAGLAPVNDVFSVSRDPKREYADSMLFDAEPGPDGTLEVRVAEIRAEESFIDRIALRAVDVPDGYAAALSPGGRAFSVRDAAPAQAVSGLDAASLAAADGEGVKGYDGVSVVAGFTAPGPGAVLLLTADGFEYDGGSRRITAKRPALRVAVYAGGRWTPVGEAHPRELADTTAFDLAPFVRGGRVEVRVTSVSCDASVYQLIDRLALSSAPSGLAHVRTLSPIVTGPSPHTAASLAARDGERAHLIPGQSVAFRLLDPGADAYVIESVGWYRGLRRGGK